MKTLTEEVSSLYEIFLYFLSKHTPSKPNELQLTKYINSLSKEGLYLISICDYEAIFSYIETNFETKILLLPQAEVDLYIRSIIDFRLDINGVVKYLILIANLIDVNINSNSKYTSTGHFKYHEFMLYSDQIIWKFVEKFPKVFANYLSNRGKDEMRSDKIQEITKTSAYFHEASSSTSTFDANFSNNIIL